MTQRKPLVLVDGLPTQIPAGDTLEATLSTGAIELINTSDRAQPLGAPVIFKAPNEFEAAKADFRPTSEVVGLLQEPVNIGITALVQSSGVLTAPAENWQLVTESEANLVPGAVYYLSTTTAGKITNVPPSGETGFVVRLGKALTNTQFQINVEPPIGL